jgi:hypothetical protein
LDLKQEIILWKYLKPQILDEILFLAKVFLKKLYPFLLNFILSHSFIFLVPSLPGVVVATHTHRR